MSSILVRDILVRLGARSLARYGTIARRTWPGDRGGEQWKEAWTRADGSLLATSIGSDLVIRKTSAGFPRLEYANLGDGLKPYILAEPNVTNRCLWSEAFSGNWALEAGEAPTPAQAHPFPGTAATRLTKTGPPTRGPLRP